MAALTTGAGILMGAGAIGGAMMDSSAYKAQGAFAMQQAQINARFAEIDAADAIKRGEQDAKEIKRQSGKLIGDQKAALAAQGISVDAGTAVALIAETNLLSDQDVITATNNAWRESWGFRAEAQNQLMQGRMAQSAAKHQSRSSLISGGMMGLASVFGGK